MKNRVSEIKTAVIEYCKENLNEQYKDMSLDILEKIEKKDVEILSSSRCDIWVASILNIVLEDNEMFKRKHPMYITKKDFSQKTGVSSKTIKSKSEIIRALLDKEDVVENTNEGQNVEICEEAIETEEVVEAPAQKQLSEKELKESKYRALMGLAHEDIPFADRLDYLKQAMIVAEEMIEDKENTTNYWNNASGRPYMMAAQDLAILLMKNKNYTEAKAILELLLEMDEDDNQGNKFKLLHLLISKNDRKAVNELFLKYKDEQSAQWDYFKALYYFKNGNLYFAKASVKEGVKKNKFIGLFLMQWTAALRASGSVIDPVLYTEATYYYNENFELWKETKGALKWLVKAVIK